MEIKVSSEALRTSDRGGNCSVNKNREFSRRDKFNGSKVSVFLPSAFFQNSSLSETGRLERAGAGYLPSLSR